MNTDPNNTLTIARVLNAPREKVWRACRERDALRQWWGQPAEATMPFCELDFRVGGRMHFAVERHGNPPFWLSCTILEIVEGERLVMEQHRSDESGAERDSAEWPASVITLTLEDQGERTKLTAVHTGMVSARASVDDYRQGWSETLDHLEECLKRL